MNIKKTTIESLSDMVERGLDEVAAKGELKTKEEVCLLKELLSAHEKLEKEESYNNGYSYEMRGGETTMPREHGGNSRDGWYITREDDRTIRNGRYPYNSYGEPDVDRIADAVRMAMRR
jgi:hypothetical protein